MFSRSHSRPGVRALTLSADSIRSPWRGVACLLTLSALGACSKSNAVGVADGDAASPRDHADQDADDGEDNADDPSSDPSDDGEATGDDPDDGEPPPDMDPAEGSACRDGRDVGELPAGSANGGLDPASFPALEADQFAAPVLIADRFTLAEGPVWDSCTQQLLFTDVEAKTIHSLAQDGSIGVYFQPTRFANGLAFDGAGRLLLAEMGTGDGGRISRLSRALELEVLIDRDPSCNLLNTTDDLTVRSDGTIYFTDPVAAHGAYFGFSFQPKPVYRLNASGAAPRLSREGQASLPNGVRLSPDEKYLYVVGYSEGRVLRFDVADDGALSGSKAFISGLTSPDSMCVDAAGNLYVGTSQGLRVFRADATPVTLIPIPSSSGTTNCAFGGDEGKTLYITAWKSLWRVDDVPIPGNDWARNRDMPCE